MSILLRVAELSDVLQVERLVRAYHQFEGVSPPDGDVIAAFSPLLGVSDLGRIWLICAEDEIVGYVAICFGYSIEFGGRDAFLDEMYVSEERRGVGIGSKTLTLVKSECAELGVRALHLEVSRSNDRAQRLYRTLGFTAREQYFLMTARLR